MRIRIDYGRFKAIVAKNRNFVGALIYMGLPDHLYAKKKRFLRYIRSKGFVIQKRPVKPTPDGKKKQIGVDVFIYRDITELGEEDAYDKAVLASGDEDFVDVVLRLKELGKEIEIWSFKNSLSHRLKVAAGMENIHYIDDILDKIKI